MKSFNLFKKVQIYIEALWQCRFKVMKTEWGLSRENYFLIHMFIWGKSLTIFCRNI
jgi:hypothetical protein